MQDDPTRSNSLFEPDCPADATQDEWVDRVIDGRYRILERLGEGGMGAVFVAEHVQLQKRVALKVIHAHFAGNDEIGARFAREAMTSAHIEHPNVASALDFGALPEGGAYLVMQLVRGPSLSEYLKQHGALSAAETCLIATQIADAITAAHAAGVVHRDLKPDNVVLMPNEAGPPTVKVLDFGIAHVKPVEGDDNSKALTRVGVVIGTPGYMPPEQAMGQGVDERADLYALGVIIWELLMGMPPFGGQTFSEIVTQQMRAPAPELKLSAEPLVPDGLRLLVRCLLQRSPAERPRSAADVRDRLRVLSMEMSATPRTLPPPGSVLDATLSSVRKLRGAFARVGQFRWALVTLAILLFIGAWKLSSDPQTQATAQEIEQPKSKADTMPASRARRLERAQAAEPAAAKTNPGEPEDAPRRARRSNKKSSPTPAKNERPKPVERLRRAIDGLLQ